MEETRRNTWKYEEFKSISHYEDLHVCEASAETVMSFRPYGYNKEITDDRFYEV